MKKQSFTFTSHNGEAVTFDCYAHGPLCVHRPFRGSTHGWQVSHLETGCAVQFVKSLKHAKEFIKHVSDLDWSGDDRHELGRRIGHDVVMRRRELGYIAADITL